MPIFSVKAVLTLASFVVFASGGVLEFNEHAHQTSIGVCPIGDSSRSCRNNPNANSCCTPKPDGLILQTQFWDTSKGENGLPLPKESWTIHGLWPNKCNGERGREICRVSHVDPSEYEEILINAGREELLQFMNTYWISNKNSNADFWAHEYNKHGTCISTFDPGCYPSDEENEDLVDFLDTVSRAWLKFPTYKWLADAGITPSDTRTYDLSAIQDALKSQTGAIPHLDCTNGKLKQVYYYNYVRGPVQRLDFKHVDATEESDCPDEVHYPERKHGSESLE